MSAPPDSVSFNVAGKTAVITGAGSGIGYCFASLLLQKGCNVLIADLSLRPEAQKLVDEFSSTNAEPRCAFVKTDVVQWPDLDNMFEVADSEFGGVDILCPCAGIFEPHWSNFWHPPSTGVSKDKANPVDTNGIGHYTILDINVTHPIRTTQIAVSRFLNPLKGSKIGKASPSNPKRIVHVSSIAAQYPSLVTPIYQASKHAISGFIRSLAELDSIGIRVNGVAPGVIRTPLWTEHPEKLKMLDTSIDEFVEPEEVAQAMLRCCVDNEVGGGYVMEVSKGRTRHVDWRNDPGPTGLGNTAANAKKKVAEVFEWLSEEGWGVVKGHEKVEVTGNGAKEMNGKRATEPDGASEVPSAKKRKLRS